MTLNKKPVAKKRGRPPGSKNKTSAAKVRAGGKIFSGRPLPDTHKIAAQGESCSIHFGYKNNILEENNAVWDELKKVSAQVADLKHKEIGYRAVISYLQARLDGNVEL
jgi:hypothetical protein